MSNRSDPAGYVFAVTPSDSADLATATRALWVGTGGNVAIHSFDPTTQKVTSVTLTAVPNGTLLPIVTRRVLSTGTTATGIVALA